MIPIYVPHLTKKAKKYVSKCIDTNWISSQGPYVHKFEKALAKFNKVKYCVATSGCTSALHLAIKSKRKTLKFRTNNQFLLIYIIS